MSVSPSSALPYHIQTTKDHTKIYKTPIAFHGEHFLSTATKWTKNRIFNNGNGTDSNHGRGGPSSTPLASSDAPTISFGNNGEAIVAYSNCIQVWNYDPKTEGGVFKFSGSTGNIESGKIIAGTLIPKASRVVVQLVKRGSNVLEVHKLSSGPTTSSNTSLEHTLVLPPSSSGPGPYFVCCPSDGDFFAVVSQANGLVTLFSNEDYHPYALSGLETTMGADGTPLLDIKGRWLVVSPKHNGAISTHTTLKLPPEGPLYERLMENLSSTAAASIKSLSDAGVAGIKSYLNKDKPDQQHQQSNPNKNSIPLNKMFNNLFMSDSNTTPIQIVDVPTQSTICHFTPLYGVSHLSLSPHDTTLATVSLNGDHVYTYDLSFLPKEVGVTGRYVRGKLPAKVRRVIWDSYGGMGIVTWEKGSLHWFDKRRSFDSTNKVWKLSRWGIEDGCFVSGGPKDEEDGHRIQLMLLKQTQIMIGDVLNGNCTWKYDIPLGAIADSSSLDKEAEEYDADIESGKSSNTEEDSTNTKKGPKSKKKRHHQNNSNTNGNGSTSTNLKRGYDDDPLSYYEMEACLPYPFIHEDHRILISVFDEEYGGPHEYYTSVNEGKVDYPKLSVFGKPITTAEIDFGKPDGQAKFASEVVSDDDEEIKKAMESMVIQPNNSNTSAPDSPETMRPVSSSPAGSQTPPTSMGSDHIDEELLVNVSDEKTDD